VEHEEFLQMTLPAMDMVNAIARRAVPNVEDAKDLVQDTYLAAFRAWTDERKPRAVKPWLATICLNLARSRYRSAQRRPNEVSMAELASMPSAADGPEERALASVDRDALEQAMWSLPEEQRIAIALVDLADMSVKEAARVMSTPVGTVLSRVHRGRRALAVRFAPAALDEARPDLPPPNPRREDLR
jgi:RNA polymerase sigma-70 factor, ECF subfamily